MKATWERAAELTGVSITTISRWVKIPGFLALVDEYERMVNATLDTQLVTAMSEMLTLWVRMVRDDSGKLARDPRIAHIKPTVLKYLDGGIAFDDAPGDSPPPAVPSLVAQFNVGAVAQT